MTLRSLAAAALFALSPLALAGPADSSADAHWEKALEHVVPAVVAIRVTAVRDFDTENAGSSVGTGFVVDAEQGLVLTNRHMVHAGPVVAEALFQNNEEVDLQAVYRDPVHDFGFYRFDPAALRDMQLHELELAPEGAVVGREIRVVGNDAGEKISILDGTLARLDRNAPSYGGNTFNDFNTFYIQAASNTSGGSSGSPVVDVEGRVVGLNAGGSRSAASSFYLPLDRVVRAMGLIQQGQSVARGTLQTVLSYTSFDEVDRLGLPDEVADQVRRAFPEGTGMLVVREVVPEGPAHGQLQPGDVLTRLNGQLITGFVALEEVLDASVGRPVDLELYRGPDKLEISLEVGDLHAITPDEFLEVSRGIVHELSYHQARNHSLPVRGVYVALPGYALGNAAVASGVIITAVDGVEVAHLDDFQREWEAKAHGQRVRLRYFSVGDQRREIETVVTVDRVWFPTRRCAWDADTGKWPCVDSPEPPALPQPEPVSFRPLSAADKVAQKLAPSMVMVDFDVSVPTAGVKNFNYVGAGLVVDAERGLVVVDRDTVPINVGDIVLTFGGSVRVPGHMVYLHPVHNLAVVGYDPDLLAGDEVRAAELRDEPLERGDTVWQVGLNRRYEVVSSRTSVEQVEALYQGVSSTPRYRDANVEGVDLDAAAPSLGGVLVDKKGRVLALWASFLDQRSEDRSFHGLPVRYLTRVLAPLCSGEPVSYRVLGAELFPIPVAEARDRGLSAERVSALVDLDPERRRVLEVIRVAGDTSASELLRNGDLVLEVDGELLSRVGPLEDLTTHDSVRLTILRDGQELKLDVETSLVVRGGVDEVVSWAGLQLHEPHYEVAAQQGIEPEGAYIAWMWYGSPAARYGIRPTRRIVEVNGQPTPDLATFLEVVRTMEDRESVRLKMIALDGRILVQTLKLDLTYWPTHTLEWIDGRWTRAPVEAP